MRSSYTRKGDDGYTNISSKDRIPKHSTIIETIGTIDELTSFLGLVRSISQLTEIKSTIKSIQRDLSYIMAEMASKQSGIKNYHYANNDKVKWIEEKIDQFRVKISLPPGFILPGDTLAAAIIDISRTTARRAERRLVALFHEEKISCPEILGYFNRLSSLLYILELYELQTTGINQLSLLDSTDDKT